MENSDTSSINLNSPISVRTQLRDILMQDIEDQRLVERIPSERALAEKYGISRGMVRETIAQMISEGILHRQGGKGTFVVKRAPRRPQTAVDERMDIGFVIDGNVFHFVETGYWRIFQSAERVCRQAGHRLLFHSVDEEEHDLSLPSNGENDAARLSGCIVTGEIRRRTTDRLQQLGVPIINVDPLFNDDIGDYVGFDYSSGIREAVKHLTDLGHEKIGFVGFPNSEKYDAYWEGLEFHSLHYNPHFVKLLQLRNLQTGIVTGYRSAQRMIASGSLPTALLATNDLVAMGIMEALEVAGVNVPDQISIIGCDDLVSDTAPPLTTLRANPEQVGRMAADSLLKKIRGEPLIAGPLKVPVQLLVRETTAAPPPPTQI